jgi:hypothetical protein
LEECGTREFEENECGAQEGDHVGVGEEESTGETVMNYAPNKCTRSRPHNANCIVNCINGAEQCRTIQDDSDT